MRSEAAAEALLLIVGLVIIYLVITPMAQRTAQSMNDSAALIEQSSQFD